VRLLFAAVTFEFGETVNVATFCFFFHATSHPRSISKFQTGKASEKRLVFAVVANPLSFVIKGNEMAIIPLAV